MQNLYISTMPLWNNSIMICFCISFSLRFFLLKLKRRALKIGLRKIHLLMILLKIRTICFRARKGIFEARIKKNKKRSVMKLPRKYRRKFNIYRLPLPPPFLKPGLSGSAGLGSNSCPLTEWRRRSRWPMRAEEILEIDRNLNNLGPNSSECTVSPDPRNTKYKF